jgi:hypothetical protein
MIKIGKALKVVIVNLVILVVLAEVASNITYYVWTRDFFYTRTSNKLDAGLTVPESVAPIGRGGVQQEMVQQLHPYFGFIDKVGLDHRTPQAKMSHLANNFGFASTYPYPFKKQKASQFLVGVFGGSVAANYSFFDMEVQTLAKALKQIPELADKEVIILPFAIGGYKQPQQLLVLSYFLSIGQDLDLVINIDGFNEVALGYVNYQHRTEISMPSDAIFLPMVNLATGDLSREELALTLEVINQRDRLASSARSLSTSRTATGYLVTWLSAKSAERSYRKLLVDLDESRSSRGRSDQSYMQIPGVMALGEDEAFEGMVALWSRSSVMMKQLLDQRKIPYFQFLQPNQYAKTGRVMGKEERAVAFNETSPLRPGAVKGYPLLLDEITRLRQAGVNVFSAVEVFDTISEPVYVDNCCHYNEAGNLAFGNYVADTIAQFLKRDPSVKQQAAAAQ